MHPSQVPPRLQHGLLQLNLRTSGPCHLSWGPEEKHQYVSSLHTVLLPHQLQVSSEFQQNLCWHLGEWNNLQYHGKGSSVVEVKVHFEHWGLAQLFQGNTPAMTPPLPLCSKIWNGINLYCGSDQQGLANYTLLIIRNKPLSERHSKKDYLPL
uniref:Uncharacterized protein n=1 Tax=Opuntia streptacantha TaxID=393608 RepID=A0A7C9DIZ5_OPUST